LSEAGRAFAACAVERSAALDLDFCKGLQIQDSTAVPQLLYPETTAAEWLFPQEKATLHDAGEGTLIVEPL
jgi:hypothetical protein